jgi:hypothetical protein
MSALSLICPRLGTLAGATGRVRRPHAHCVTESLEERRAGQLLSQLRNRPWLGRTFVHPSYRDRAASIGKPAQEASRFALLFIPGS